MSKLTLKQEKFCEEYLVDLNATQAAIRAGYSEKRAKETGCENVTKRNIQEKIQELRKEVSKNTGITVERVLEEEALIAFYDLREIFDSDEGTPISPHELPEKVARALAGIEVTERVLKSFDGVGSVVEVKYKYKFNDKGRALERIGRHLGMFQAEKLNDEDVDRVAERIVAARKRVESNG